MRTAAGLQLAYVSDERRLQNANQSMSIGEANHNFNLHVADIAADGTQWGFRFSAIHATNPGLCSRGDAAVAQWVYRFGQWIDNHMPRDTGAPYGWKYDWYHPSVDAAVSSADCAATELRVGFWDDTGRVAELLVFVDDLPVASYGEHRNGSVLVPLSAVTPTSSVRVVARDYADNRQIYAKGVAELLSECRRANPPPRLMPTRLAPRPGRSRSSLAR